MTILITGGAGFIGTNLAIAATRRDHSVVALDSFAKPGSRENGRIVSRLPRTRIIVHDVSRPLPGSLNVDCIVHLAANVNADKAFRYPRRDFAVNALGTLNVLEFARKHGSVPVIYASSCKIYSTKINTLPLTETEQRYDFAQIDGIGEDFPVDGECRYGRGPYGCSKYVGDLYAQEYHTLHNLPVTINRLSAVYGPHQHGVSGYGWVYWFIKAFKKGLPITIYGTGKQVRDVLHVDDLSRLLLEQIENFQKHAGQIYNVGGARRNSLSLLQLIDMLGELDGKRSTNSVIFQQPRPADFKVYISDIKKVTRAANWCPQISVEDGVEKLWKEFS
jgi:CDP-paratose 2-epimerase